MSEVSPAGGKSPLAAKWVVADAAIDEPVSVGVSLVTGNQQRMFRNSGFAEPFPATESAAYSVTCDANSLRCLSGKLIRASRENNPAEQGINSSEQAFAEMRPSGLGTR
jgi:hypothetical protein